jgi:hypothetical protein
MIVSISVTHALKKENNLMRDRTYIFYPAPAGGKWHTVDRMTGVATCHNAIMDTNTPPIHVSPHQDTFHPLLCRRCLAKK